MANISFDMSQVRADKYFTVDITSRTGMNHQIGAMRWLVAEAIALGRTPVIPVPSLNSIHNFGRNIQTTFSKYLDLERIIIRADGKSFFFKAIQSGDLPELAGLSALKVEKEKIITSEQNADYDMIIRKNPNGMTIRNIHANFKFSVAFNSSGPVLGCYTGISDKLKDYCAMHVRRGDKLTEKPYPNLDRDTRPEKILETLSGMLPKGSTIYIMTNETDRHYFDSLTKHYHILQYFDFPELKGLIESESPDNFFLYEVEKIIFQKAPRKIYTFSDPSGKPRPCLTSDVGWS